MSARFSIIVPVYNVAPYLRECLDSVLSQTFTDFEVICVDDGSTDDSGKILDEYAGKVKVLHQPNSGVGSARNAALDVATGEWLVFLDGDDILAPSALSRLSEIICDCKPDIRLIRFRYLEFGHGESVIWPERQPSAPRRIDISKRMEWEDFYVYMWEFAYRRDVIGAVTFPSFRRGEDRVFVNTILLNNVDSFLSVGDVCYGYRQRDGSSMHSFADKDVLKDELSHRVRIIELMDSSPKEIHYRHSDWLEAYCVRYYHQHVWECDASGRRELVSWFNHLLPHLRRARDFSCQSRFALFLCSLFASVFGPRFTAFNYPLLFERFAILLFNPTRVLRSFALRFKMAK